jgi:hypothetical protein
MMAQAQPPRLPSNIPILTAPPVTAPFPIPNLPGITGPLMMNPAQAQPGTQLACGAPQGTHVNKTSYFRRDGSGNAMYVQKGTACVRNRRMNPLNPRALSRAMTRITSAKRAASCLGRITIRKSKCRSC